jgi:hypothetical protein
MRNEEIVLRVEYFWENADGETLQAYQNSRGLTGRDEDLAEFLGSEADIARRLTEVIESRG